ATPGEAGQHLAWRHHLMALARTEGLLFVPAVLHATSGATFVQIDGRCWELMEWLPGRADYRSAPSPVRLPAVARSLALLHEIWRRAAEGTAVCPAVLRRCELVRGWQPVGASVASAGLLMDQVRSVLGVWLPRLPRLLQPWQARACLVQPCL